ncbi:MAG: DUF3631 domain-containing protein [Dehalococcoidia bacterium]|nr:DUF3631 domain-containing protein [Dehalococcoidia bacterium]
MTTAIAHDSQSEAVEAGVMRRQGRREGAELRFLCPAHDDHHPSARYHPTKQVWVCDVCGAGGGLVDLANRLGIATPGRNGSKPPTLAELAAHKKLPLNHLIKHGWHDLPGGGVGIPYKATDGKTLHVKRRMALVAKEGSYWPAHTPVMAYGLEGLSKARLMGYLHLLEGETDTITLWFHEQPAIGIPGANNAKTLEASHLAGLGKLYVWREPDAGGEAFVKGVGERLKAINWMGETFVISIPGVKDASELHIMSDGPEAFCGDLERAMAEATLEWEPRANGTAQLTALDATHAFLGRFIAYPSQHAHVAHTLWIGHTHLMNAWECTPRIAFLSPEPASGKTRALEITALLVPRPVEAVNVTPAYLFRKVADDNGRPTILYDEIDTVFGPRAKENEEIRGLLNAGHRVGAVAGRCVVKGKTIVTEEIPAYCAVALAGLGGLPDTILSRCVIIRMRRRAPGENIEPYRIRGHGPEGRRIGERLAAWANAVQRQAQDAWPIMPDGIEDRNADLWEPLLVVADLVGGEWPTRARVAAVAHVADSKAGTPSLGIRLLADLRICFGDHDVLATSAIIHELHQLEEAPWCELIGGKPLNARGLAQRLHQYGITSRTVRIGGDTPRGYRREDLHDAWARYLPNLLARSSFSTLCQVGEAKEGVGVPAQDSATSATSATKMMGDDEELPF